MSALTPLPQDLRHYPCRQGLRLLRENLAGVDLLGEQYIVPPGLLPCRRLLRAEGWRQDPVPRVLNTLGARRSAIVFIRQMIAGAVCFMRLGRPGLRNR